MEQEIRFLRSKVCKLEARLDLLSNTVEDKINLVLTRFFNQKVAEISKQKTNLQLEEDLYKSLLSACSNTTTAATSNSHGTKTQDNGHGHGQDAAGCNGLKKRKVVAAADRTNNHHNQSSKSAKRLAILKRKSKLTKPKPTKIRWTIPPKNSVRRQSVITSVSFQLPPPAPPPTLSEKQEGDPCTSSQLGRGQRSKKKKYEEDHHPSNGFEFIEKDGFTTNNNTNNDQDEFVSPAADDDGEDVVEVLQFQNKAEPQNKETQEGPVNVWSQFIRSVDRPVATCKLCSREIKTTNSGTSGLHAHLKKVHQISTEKCKRGAPHHSVNYGYDDVMGGGGEQ